MLDPVANTLDLRRPFDRQRAGRIHTALKATGIGLSDIAYFDNMLHHDPALRKKKHDFMMRTFEAASLLEVDAVCGFVGRNQQHSMDQNLIDFDEHFIPLKAAKERGLTFRVEQCPMPGWTAGDNFHNNIGYTPGAWIALHRICEKHGGRSVSNSLRSVTRRFLWGRTRSIFQHLKTRATAFSSADST
jgi:sugar phosphate isomerase/epimerase